MVDDRHVGAIDRGLRILRGGAAYEEEARDAGWARDAGQVLNRLERVAVRPGDAIDFALRDRALRDLARRLVAFDGDLDAFAFRVDAVFHFARFAFGELFLRVEWLEPFGLHRDRVGAGRDAVERECAIAVGRDGERCHACGDRREGDDRARERDVDAADQNDAVEALRRCRRRPIRVAFRAEREREAVPHVARRGLPGVVGPGVEGDLERGLLCGFIEAVTRALFDDSALHDAGGVDLEIEHDLAFEALVRRVLRVLGGDVGLRLRIGRLRARWRLRALRRNDDRARGPARRRHVATIRRRRVLREGRTHKEEPENHRADYDETRDHGLSLAHTGSRRLRTAQRRSMRTTVNPPSTAKGIHGVS